MGPRNDPMAVVDSSLRVYGIKNLRVIDCGIMPTITTGNTNVPTFMIAEKAADMVKMEHLGRQSNVPRDRYDSGHQIHHHTYHDQGYGSSYRNKYESSQDDYSPQNNYDYNRRDDNRRTNDNRSDNRRPNYSQNYNSRQNYETMLRSNQIPRNLDDNLQDNGSFQENFVGNERNLEENQPNLNKYAPRENRILKEQNNFINDSQFA